MLLALNIAGFSFVGIDIPGFYGMPSDQLQVLFYKLSVFYPLMRVHNHIETQGREPWL